MTPRPLTAAVIAGALALAGCGSSSSSSSSASSSGATATSSGASSTSSGSATTSSQIGFEGVPIEQGPVLSPASTTGTAPADGIECGATEQLAYHIHVHLQVYVNGQPRALPGGIGIPGSVVEQSSEGPVAAGGQCIYWLHTHAPDGVIHIESPTAEIYTLGEFFDEWHQPLSATQVASATGKVTAVVNGKPFAGNPRDIRLVPHAVIQLSVGSPVVPFKPMSWAGLQL
jgi:hypothetical protein